MFLHRQAMRARAAHRLKYGLEAAQAPAAARDIGSIAILEDSDGVVARRNEFNLDQRTLTLLPAAAGATRYRFQVGDPSYDTAAALSGTPLPLGDDDTRAVVLPFTFPFFGTRYQQVYINSDGNLTFTAGDNASTDRSLGRMAGGAPRIAPLFVDLDPSQVPGSVRYLAESGRFVVSWNATPLYSDFGTGVRQTFQARLYPDGRIEFAYNGIATDAAVVGIAPGNLQGSSTILDFLTTPSGDYTAMVAERFGGTLEVDVETAAQKFYETHDDSYDYLVFYNNLNIPAGLNAVSYEFTVRNNRSGYGDVQVEVGREFGSASRLQAVLNMGNLAQFPKDPKGIVAARAMVRDTPITILAHETGHLFLAYASVRDSNDPSARPMLGYQNAHWVFNFNSDASLLEGNRIRDDGATAEPRFTTVGTVEGYSPLDQYLMGLIPAGEVEPGYPFGLFVATGVPLSFNRKLPQTGITFDGGRRDTPVAEIIQAEGRRTPDYTVAQRHFRFAFILIVGQGTQPSADDLAQVDTYRAQFETYYQQAASNHAFADTALRRSLGLSIFPAAGVIAGRTASAAVSVQAPPTAPLTVLLKAQGGNVTLPASVTIPAGATSAAFTLTGGSGGVDEISATPGDSAYDTAYARVQVAAPSTLQLATVSGDGQHSGNGGPLPQPIVVRVTDINNLPYPGARVQAAASAGGSVTPQEAAADASGNVTFTWTPGSPAAAQLRLALADAPAVAVTVRANSSAILAATVLNAASNVAGASPGSMATIFGANFVGAANPASVQLTLGGRALPVLYTSDTQINFYIPDDLPLGAADLVISNALGSSAPVRVPITAVSPGIFFDSSSGFGAILLAGTAETTDAQPAAPGDYVEIYCTGLGTFPPQVLIGGVDAPVVYSGLAPGFLGLNQVNVRIPDDTPSGAQPLSLTVNGVQSNVVRIGVR